MEAIGSMAEGKLVRLQHSLRSDRPWRRTLSIARWRRGSACRAHNPKVDGSNPSPANGVTVLEEDVKHSGVAQRFSVSGS